MFDYMYVFVCEFRETKQTKQKTQEQVRKKRKRLCVHPPQPLWMIGACSAAAAA